MTPWMSAAMRAPTGDCMSGSSSPAVEQTIKKQQALDQFKVGYQQSARSQWCLILRVQILECTACKHWSPPRQTHPSTVTYPEAHAHHSVGDPRQAVAALLAERVRRQLSLQRYPAVLLRRAAAPQAPPQARHPLPRRTAAGWLTRAAHPGESAPLPCLGPSLARPPRPPARPLRLPAPPPRPGAGSYTGHSHLGWHVLPDHTPLQLPLPCRMYPAICGGADGTSRASITQSALTHLSSIHHIRQKH